MSDKLIVKMLKPIMWQICRQKNSVAYANITSTRTTNSYRIILSDPKTRYVYNMYSFFSGYFYLTKNAIKFTIF